jgi:hypothetical protein
MMKLVLGMPLRLLLSDISLMKERRIRGTNSERKLVGRPQDMRASSMMDCNLQLPGELILLWLKLDHGTW